MSAVPSAAACRAARAASGGGAAPLPPAARLWCAERLSLTEPAMDLAGKLAVVTGGARGIGRAIAQVLKDAGARVAVCDLDEAAASEAGAALGGLGARVDVGSEAALARFLTRVQRELGAIDVYVSNAGLGFGDGPLWTPSSAPNEAWEANWRVNVMASVYAARHAVPGMLARGGGTFVVVASAAGLLNQIGDAAYTASKHAAVAFAESLAIAHGDDGLKVHCLCPEGVRTDMVKGIEAGVQGLSGYVEPADAARALLAAMAEGRFLVFTHPTTAGYVRTKAEDRDRWLGGMRKLRRGLIEKLGRPL